MSELVRNKDLKNRVRFSTSLDKDLAKRLEDLSITTRIPKSKLVDEAIEILLDKHENKLK
ncbi:ribbon-helix-helix domain-containing protein [uncultured Clostridium sp.]|uniref:ribbon-helix-helix domain-containing protein n=1 Tax=uncultured Clostridium sp. TaxID=59620 RepID=UPI002612713B|nr:ribbon-helix-helix domain-containing protein [uncultured Clostridium sp.]